MLACRWVLIVSTSLPDARLMYNPHVELNTFVVTLLANLFWSQEELCACFSGIALPPFRRFQACTCAPCQSVRREPYKLDL